MMVLVAVERAQHKHPLSVPFRLGIPAYMLQAKTKGKVCIHTLPHATAVLEPTSLLRGGGAPALPHAQGSGPLPSA
jgi:hypothetical protein